MSWPNKNGRHLVAYLLTVKNVMFIKTGLNERSKLVMAFIEKFSFPLLLCFYFHHSYSPVFRRVGFSLKASQYDQVNWFHFTVLHIFARLGVFPSEIRLLNYEDRSGNRYSVDYIAYTCLFLCSRPGLFFPSWVNHISNHLPYICEDLCFKVSMPSGSQMNRHHMPRFHDHLQSL